ncbi:methanogen output domain 1-containing protein [Methanobacterium sp. ACI-7]|uniref:methanogen output domain 1-containing protein n=1 Tax=unclassified Methanobacterium TaxID=2627676 RepID=UPI0039C15A28
MKSKILIVEDEKILAMGLKHKLDIMGYEVVGITSSGLEAIEKAREEFPNLILMDIVLKGQMDGIEAAQKIINLYNIPVIYTTAYADEEILERAMVTEPYGYLTKPYNEAQLHANIKMALHKHKKENQRKESMENQLTDDYYQFIIKNINQSTDEVRNKLLKTFEESFEEKKLSKFYEELQNKNIDVSNDNEHVLFNEYISWVSRLFNDLGIKNKLKYDMDSYYFELFNCPWMHHAGKNHIFCINCQAMISRSFKWINLDGKISNISTIAEGLPKCSFIIQ